MLGNNKLPRRTCQFIFNMLVIGIINLSKSWLYKRDEKNKNINRTVHCCFSLARFGVA